jgi:hypothetical protein
MIDISKADKVEVLLRLFNDGHNVSMFEQKYGQGSPTAELASRLQAQATPVMTREQAQRFVASGRLSFDYVGPRKFLVNLSGDTFDETMYDRDAGPGHARRVLEGLEGVRFL